MNYLIVETAVAIQVNRFLRSLKVMFAHNSKHIFSSDLEYLGLQLVIQITLEKSSQLCDLRKTPMGTYS